MTRGRDGDDNQTLRNLRGSRAYWRAMTHAFMFWLSYQISRDCGYATWYARTGLFLVLAAVLMIVAAYVDDRTG